MGWNKPSSGGLSGGGAYAIYNKLTNGNPAVFTSEANRDAYFIANPSELSGISSKPYMIGVGTSGEDPNSVNGIAGWFAFNAVGFPSGWQSLATILKGAEGEKGPPGNGSDDIEPSISDMCLWSPINTDRKLVRQVQDLFGSNTMRFNAINAAKITGAAVVARRAGVSEQITTINNIVEGENSFLVNFTQNDIDKLVTGSGDIDIILTLTTATGAHNLFGTCISIYHGKSSLSVNSSVILAPKKYYDGLPNKAGVAVVDVLQDAVIQVNPTSIIDITMLPASFDLSFTAINSGSADATFDQGSAPGVPNAVVEGHFDVAPGEIVRCNYFESSKTYYFYRIYPDPIQNA